MQHANTIKPGSFCFAAWLLIAGCGSSRTDLRAGAVAIELPVTIEPFEDENGNGTYDPGESFDDADGNGAWTPVWIAGFGSGRWAQGVHDQPEAGILYLEDGATRLAIVGVDWVGFLHDDYLALSRAVWDAGIPLDGLIVSSTHNHEGPDTVGIWGRPEKAQSGIDPAYMSRSQQAIVAGIATARQNATEVRIQGGLGKTEGLISDSRLPEVIDETVQAFRFERTDGNGPVAVVAHWANHPECLGGRNRQVSADFPHFLRRTIEAATPGAVAIYWQGPVGGLMNPLDVTVRDEQGNPLPKDSFEKTERLGILAGEAALRALDEARDISGDGRIRFRRRTFQVPFQNLDLALAMMGGLLSRSIFDENGIPMSTSELPSDRVHIQTEVAVVDIGEIQIATVPGELYPELALVRPDGGTYFPDPQDPNSDFPGLPCGAPIRAGMRDTPFQVVLGLANDELGYIIPKCQWDAQPPWTFGETEAPYGEGLSPGPEMAPILQSVLAEELAALAGH